LPPLPYARSVAQDASYLMGFSDWTTAAL